MANPTGQEMREAVTVVAERMGYGKLYDRLVHLNAFVSRRRPPTPAILADRLYNLSGGLRRQVPATIAFHTVWAECIGRGIGEEHDKTLEAIADRINATGYAWSTRCARSWLAARPGRSRPAGTWPSSG